MIILKILGSLSSPQIVCAVCHSQIPSKPKLFFSRQFGNTTFSKLYQPLGEKNLRILHVVETRPRHTAKMRFMTPKEMVVIMKNMRGAVHGRNS